MIVQRIHFEDRGQDFLWWDIDEEGFVVDCGPFQGWVWKQYRIADPDTLYVGDRPLIRRVFDRRSPEVNCSDADFLNYRIVDIDDPRKVAA